MHQNISKAGTFCDPHQAVYAYIGQRIRDRRKMLKLSQGQLAEMMGFSYQQMQKYETGASQASVSRLLQFAKILNVPPEYFYEGASLNDEIGVGITSDLIQKYRTSPLRILLVENSAADVILFRKSLAACTEQVDVHVIHDVEKVGDFLRNHQTKYGKEKPDLVIFDLMLPKISGMQLLRSIKGNADTAMLPVVILTNSISRKEMQEAYRAGASGFIQKNVDNEKYMESIVLAVQYWARAVVLPAM